MRHPKDFFFSSEKQIFLSYSDSFLCFCCKFLFNKSLKKKKKKKKEKILKELQLKFSVNSEICHKIFMQYLLNKYILSYIKIEIRYLFLGFYV